MELFKLFGTIAINAGNAETEIDSIVSSAQEAGAALSQAGQQANNAGKQIGKNGAFGTGSVWLGNMLTKATSAAMNFGKSLVKSGFEYNSQMEQLTTSFATKMDGDTEAAQNLVAELQQLAKVTPMETLGLAKTANLLMGYGISAEDIIATLTMLGDVAGGNQEKLDHLALAYGQAMGAGKLNAQDANQMINAGVPVWKMLAEHMSAVALETAKLEDAEFSEENFVPFSVADIREMAAGGEITAETLTDVFRAATSEGGMYYKAMENQSKTYAGQLSTMQDTADQAKGALLSPFFDVVSSDVLPQLLTLFEEFSDWCIENKEALLEFAKALGKFTVDGITALLDTFKWLVENDGALTGVLTALGLAFAGVAVATHPILSALAAITGFVMWLAGNDQTKRAMELEGATADTHTVKTAGKYGHWTAAQKEAANDYITAVAIDDWTWRDNSAQKMLDAGLNQEDVDGFISDLETAIGEGDYWVTIQETWFAENTEANLQTELDGMNLEATVSVTPEYALQSFVDTNGAYLPGYSADGSHANGLDRVPFDGYRAILHKDEAVLNAANASVWRSGGVMGDTSRLEAKLDSLLTVMSQVVTNTGRNQTVVLDSGALVGQIAPQMDAQLGTMTARKGRRN